MKITIEIEPKEIADLINSLQNQLGEKFSEAVTNVLVQAIHSDPPENSYL